MVTDDGEGLSGGDEVELFRDGEDGGDILSIVGVLKRTVPISGRCMATASRSQAAELIFDGHLR